MVTLVVFCTFLPRGAMHKRGLCRRAVSVRPSVTFVYSVETSKHIFKFLLYSSSHTILVVPYQTLWQYYDWGPLTEASNAGGVATYRDSRRISGYQSMTAVVRSTIDGRQCSSA